MSYFSNQERPIFLNFLNREANHASKASRKERDDITAVDALTVTHCCGMTANISQMLEYAHSYPKLKDVIEKLIRAGILVSTSHSTDLNDFIASRQKIYRNVADRYPMYFGESADLERFPILKSNTFSMTRLLRRDIFDYDPSKFPMLGSHALDKDIANFGAAVGEIQRSLMANAEIAITRGNLEKVASKGVLTDPVLASSARIFSARYFDHYKEHNAAAIPSGVGLLGYLDDLSYFPHFDVPVLSRALSLLNWQQLDTIPNIRERVYSAYGNGLHREFVGEVNALILTCFKEVSKQVNKPLGADNADTIRRMVSNTLGSVLDRVKDQYSKPVTSFDEFLEVSVEKIHSAARQEGARNKSFGKEWEYFMGSIKKVTVLLLTATDKEDDALLESLKLSGFRLLGYRNAGKAIASEFGRGPSVRLYHCRTSAGSTGSGGSELGAYDAFQAFMPDYTVAVGICFGLQEEKQKIGDILVSDRISDYEMVRVGEAVTTERGVRVPTASKLLSASRVLRAQYNEGSPSVFHGEIVSGLKLVDNIEFRASLIARFPDAIGGEMEATGIASAADRIPRDWIVVKAICDWGMAKDDGDQRLSASNAAEFVLKLIDIVATVDLDHGKPS